MPNLIHSLDAHSMTSLFYFFSRKYNDLQFYSVHDCFGTTADKIDTLKNLLVFVYIELYSSDHYLEKFDKGIIKYIKENTNYKWKGRTIYINEDDYELFDIDWVLNNKLLNDTEVKRIDNQFIVI